MAYKLSPSLSQSLLTAFKGGMDGCFLHLFAGPVPAAPGDALNMVASHTLLAVISVDGDGVTGLTFDAPVAAALNKAAAEAWEGIFAFDGAGEASATLNASFFRIAPTADNCQGAGSGLRLQGTITATGGGGDMERSTTEVANGAPVAIDGFVVRVGSLA